MTQHHVAQAGVTHPGAQPIESVIAGRLQQARSKPPVTRYQPARAPAAPALSSIAQAIEARGRRYRIFPVSGIFGVGGKAIEYIGILYPTGKDVEAALFRAHQGLADLAAKGAGALAYDADAVTSAKQREILYALTCDALGPDRLRTVVATGKPYPAFKSSAWMRDNLGPDEEAVLMRLVAEVRAEFAPRGGVEATDDPAAIAAELDATVEAPGALLAGLGRSDLTALTVALARRLVEATRARDALMAEREASEAAPPCA